MSIRNLLLAVIFAVFPFAQSIASEMDPEMAVAKYGNVIGRQSLPVGGLTAWTVEKDGRQIVLYTTPPGPKMAVMAGVVWDPTTGADVSAAPAAQPRSMTPTSPVAAGDALRVSPGSAMNGTYVGEIPEAMRVVDSLQGIKEGSGGIGDTVYVIIDPRCPYCQKAYENTRPYVEKGYTIKWIPTAALGDSANGVPLAATLLMEKDPAALSRMLSHRQMTKTTPTPEVEEALKLNLAFMFAAFEQNGSERAGVPVAFYIDHRTGKPKMTTGLSEQPIMLDIFGDL
ncbi:hypothetical protein [Castellaniella sp.]|uniref:hypothetical protein n=1 Tax=Castellaniella sp. TaxID=1955812 RepID=UPI002AFF67A1|nr:hypothetical protein [Castellaniella sp.]